MRPSADDDGAVLRELLQGVPLRARRQNRSFPRVTFLRYGYAAHQLIPRQPLAQGCKFSTQFVYNTTHDALFSHETLKSLPCYLSLYLASVLANRVRNLQPYIRQNAHHSFLSFTKSTFLNSSSQHCICGCFLFRILVIGFHFYLFLVHTNSTKRVFQFSISIHCYSLEEINIPRLFYQNNPIFVD